MKLNEHKTILKNENKIRDIFSKIKSSIKENALKLAMAAVLACAAAQGGYNVLHKDLDFKTTKQVASDCQELVDRKLDAYMQKIIPMYADGYNLTIEEMDELGKIVSEKARERYRFFEETIMSEKKTNREKARAISDFYADMQKEIDNAFKEKVEEFKKRPR